MKTIAKHCDGFAGAPAANVLSRHPRGTEAGAGTALIAAVIVIGAVIASIAVTIGTYVMAVNRAHDAADLVALSAGAAAASLRDACAVARQSADDNGVTLTACDATGDALDFVVRVSVAVRVGLPGLPDRVEATAYAGWLGR